MLGPAAVMLVAVSQLDRSPLDHDEALAWFEAAMAEAAGADLLVLPELALTGYGDAAGVRRLAVATDAPVIGHLQALAARHRLALAFGYAEQVEEGLYDSLLLLGQGGEILANYRKVHLWGDYERALFLPGEPAPVVPLAGCRLGLMICYDLDFPEAARDLALRGADSLVVVSATTEPYAVVPEAVVPARAYETGCFLVFANRGGADGDCVFTGRSRVAAPDGALLAALTDNAPALLRAEVAPADYASWRAAHSYLQDRRTDLFRR